MILGCCFGVDFFAASSAIYKTTEKVKQCKKNMRVHSSQPVRVFDTILEADNLLVTGLRPAAFCFGEDFLAAR